MWKCVSVTSAKKTLGVAIDADVHLSAVDLGSIHHPAGLLSTFRAVKSHRPTALWLPVLLLDVGEHHLACSRQGGAMKQMQRFFIMKCQVLWGLLKLALKIEFTINQKLTAVTELLLQLLPRQVIRQLQITHTHTRTLKSIRLSTLPFLTGKTMPLKRRIWYK